MKFQKIISGAVCLAVAVSSMSALGAVVADAVNLENVAPVNASDSDTALRSGTLENGLEYEVYEDHVAITGYDESVEGEIIIPETIEGLPVTSIGASAFYCCYNLKSIIIPDSVTSIGLWAFFDCSALKSVIIPNGITSIEERTFCNCSSLTSVIIPDSVTSIGDNTFEGCINLLSATIPDSVTDIGEWAFYNCIALTSVVIPDNVTSIGEGAFSGCSALESVTIPDSVTSIGVLAFSECFFLMSVVIPDSVTSIGKAAFFNCSSLKSIKIPDNIISIGEWTFSGCSALESVTIPDSVTSIGEGVFAKCSALESIKIQNPECKIWDENNAIYNGSETINDTAVIYGYSGSTAQVYAEKHNMEFVALDENQEILWGDANEDGEVDIADVVRMNRVYVGVDEVTAQGLQNADVDLSGKIELSDSMNVLKLLVHLLTPEDFPMKA